MTAKDLVAAQLYPSEEEAVQDAFRHLLRSRPEARLQLALHRYQAEGISLAKAAHLAGMSWAQMRDILRERGVELRLGPTELEEAKEEIGTLRRILPQEP